MIYELIFVDEKGQESIQDRSINLDRLLVNAHAANKLLDQEGREEAGFYLVRPAYRGKRR